MSKTFSDGTLIINGNTAYSAKTLENKYQKNEIIIRKTIASLHEAAPMGGAAPVMEREAAHERSVFAKSKVLCVIAVLLEDSIFMS